MHKNRRPLIAGNWKMNGDRQSISELLRTLKQGCEHIEIAELAVFAPFIYLPLCANLLMKTQVAWGGQNVASQGQGAYTGEVSATMLRDYQCSYVIVGHSERRTLYGETNEVVAVKCQQALTAGLKPILCVGETLEDRQQNKTLDIIDQQLAVALTLNDNHNHLKEMVVAYEPVWAIGTGQQATTEQIQEVHAAIRRTLGRYHDELASSVRIIYGGSVKANNAGVILALADVDGVLVGGASLDAEQFLEIGIICNN